jgi:uncharacterized membrane protein YeiB
LGLRIVYYTLEAVIIIYSWAVVSFPFEAGPPVPIQINDGLRLALELLGAAAAVIAVVLGRTLLEPTRLARFSADSSTPYLQVVCTYLLIYALAEVPMVVGLALLITSGSMSLAGFASILVLLLVPSPGGGRWSELSARLGRPEHAMAR